jgi:hypothetical protein
MYSNLLLLVLYLLSPPLISIQVLGRVLIIQILQGVFLGLYLKQSLSPFSFYLIGNEAFIVGLLVGILVGIFKVEYANNFGALTSSVLNT